MLEKLYSCICVTWNPEWSDSSRQKQGGCNLKTDSRLPLNDRSADSQQSMDQLAAKKEEVELPGPIL